MWVGFLLVIYRILSLPQKYHTYQPGDTYLTERVRRDAVQVQGGGVAAHFGFLGYLNVGLAVCLCVAHLDENRSKDDE